MDESVATEHSLKDLKARFPSLGVLGSFWAHDHDADTGTQLEALFENLIEILCGGHAGRALGKRVDKFSKRKDVGQSFITQCINTCKKQGLE